MSQAQALYRLQEIELGILRSQKRLSEITAALGDNHAVAEAQAHVDTAQRALTPLQSQARNLELEIQSNAEKIRTTDEHLYSGRVRNPKEMQEMQQEIGSLKKRSADLEDRLLEVMLAVEEAEGELAGSKAALEQATGAWADENRQLLGEQAQLKESLKGLLRQREQALTEVTAESLSQYNGIKPRRHNQPVAILDGDTCSACGVEQTMAIILEVDRGAALAKCLSCGRILARKAGKG